MALLHGIGVRASLVHSLYPQDPCGLLFARLLATETEEAVWPGQEADAQCLLASPVGPTAMAASTCALGYLCVSHLWAFRPWSQVNRREPRNQDWEGSDLA